MDLIFRYELWKIVLRFSEDVNLKGKVELKRILRKSKFWKVVNKN